MNKLGFLVAILTIGSLAGCSSDIVTTDRLKTIKHRCVYVAPIQSADPYIGKVISDIMEKEFIRRHFPICGPKNATIIITGYTFMTVRSAATARKLKSNQSAAANEAIDSISVKINDRDGNLLATASYSNTELYTVSKVATKLGADLANKLNK